MATDGVYSINGYLDAAADTQWVRVTPLRTSILTTPDPVDAVVTLEHLGTGRVVEMNPSVFTFLSPNFVGGAAYGHNFWSDEAIELGATYRLTAVRSDGESSTAVVKIPGGFGAVPVTIGVNSQAGYFDHTAYVEIPIPSGDHLMAVGVQHNRKPPPHVCYRSDIPTEVTLYPFPAERPMGPVVYRSGILSRSVLLPNPTSCVGTNPPQTYASWDIWLVLSGERWPYSPGDPIGYLDQGSNVENGVGYLGGIVRKTYRLPFCRLFGTGAPEFCEMTFREESASLDVMTRSDGAAAVSRGGIRLRMGEEIWTRSGDIYPFELPDPLDFVPDPPIDVARFPGLEAGSYRIEVPGGPLYYCEERSVVLSPGENRILEIEMVRRQFFPNEPVNARGCREG